MWATDLDRELLISFGPSAAYWGIDGRLIVALWLSMAVIAAMEIYLSIKLPGIWSGKSEMAQRMETNLVSSLGSRWAAAAVRSIPAMVVAMWWALVSVVAGELGFSAVATLATFASVVLLFVAFLVLFTGRPGLLVPARFRE